MLNKTAKVTHDYGVKEVSTRRSGFSRDRCFDLASDRG